MTKIRISAVLSVTTYYIVTKKVLISHVNKSIENYNKEYNTSIHLVDITTWHWIEYIIQ